MQNDKKEMRRSYLYKGITAFSVIAASVFFYFFMLRIDKISDFVSKVFNVLQPVIIGVVMAYLVNPILNFLNGKLIPFFKKRMKSAHTAETLSNVISVIVSILVLCIVLFGFVALVVPQFAESISEIVKTLPKQISEWGAKSRKFVKSDSFLETIYKRVEQYGEKWVETDLASFAGKLGTSVANGVLDVANFLKNIIIGIIVAVYLLFSKRTFVNQSRKVFYALFKEETVNGIFSWLSKTHEVFSGFINGKLIDSLIIGIICFIGTALLRMPYAVLISCVIGVTNVIPVFGPWIGGIPCTILVMLVNPLKGLYLGIFIILLQTLDGNIIGPKILGSKTGLNNFWVIFAIIVGGGLFGVVGMLIGVPTFALIYRIIGSFINSKLAKKNKSRNSADYYKSNGDLKPKQDEVSDKTDGGGEALA